MLLIRLALSGKRVFATLEDEARLTTKCSVDLKLALRLRSSRKALLAPLSATNDEIGFELKIIF